MSKYITNCYFNKNVCGNCEKILLKIKQIFELEINYKQSIYLAIQVIILNCLARKSIDTNVFLIIYLFLLVN